MADDRSTEDDRTHNGNHAPLPEGVRLDPGYCEGCDKERALRGGFVGPLDTGDWRCSVCGNDPTDPTLHATDCPTIGTPAQHDPATRCCGTNEACSAPGCTGTPAPDSTPTVREAGDIAAVLAYLDECSDDIEGAHLVGQDGEVDVWVHTRRQVMAWLGEYLPDALRAALAPETPGDAT